MFPQTVVVESIMTLTLAQKLRVESRRVAPRSATVSPRLGLTVRLEDIGTSISRGCLSLGVSIFSLNIMVLRSSLGVVRTCSQLTFRRAYQGHGLIRTRYDRVPNPALHRQNLGETHQHTPLEVGTLMQFGAAKSSQERWTRWCGCLKPKMVMESL